MANRVLRDQCEHGRYEEHGEHLGEREKAEGVRPCPGGREVTITEEQSGDRFRTVKGKVNPQRRWVTEWEASDG